MRQWVTHLHLLLRMLIINLVHLHICSGHKCRILLEEFIALSSAIDLLDLDLHILMPLRLAVVPVLIHSRAITIVIRLPSDPDFRLTHGILRIVHVVSFLSSLLRLSF